MSGSASLNSLSLRLPTSPLTSGTHRHRSSLISSFSTSQPPSFPSLTIQFKRSTPLFIPFATTDDDEWGKEPTTGGGDVAVAEPEEAVVVTETDELKNKLKELLYGTDRGLNASSETRAEIVELITQLEAKNPTPAPTEALPLLNGKWILAYTSFSQLLTLFGSRRLPQLVKVEEISQTIDSEAFTVQNSVSFAGPLATTSVTTNAKFEIRSPKRVQIKFEEGIVGTPQLTDSIVLPEKFEFLGQNIDLSPFKGIFTSIQDAASSVARTISGQPPLKIPINNNKAQSWLLTTYLDEELRISRGDGGSIFVLIKEGSSLLS
ncbi:chromoplast-specific carotenoid-associated protein [Carex littledalei]|uniref:Chromoplast-specific carotenoid-associated protein n=1 Tax=Carex littledalei TaxID=544730 RepID=A0A833QMW0_9POAL|nr:chromoplast-specific carotenoid-associated protein [Carex littledalei]